jgi:type IV secretory pathway VirB10-like protein
MALSYRPPVTPLSETPASSNEQKAMTDRTGGSDHTSVPTAAVISNEHVLYEGTILETVLTNRLDSTFSGPVNCLVTTNVYAPDGPTLVIPQGTRVLGEVKKVESLGQGRLAVVFHRLIRPDFSSVNLDQFQGLSQIGETGLRDQVNHHYLEMFGASIAIGAIAGLAQANTRYGADESAAAAYQQGVSSSLSQSSLHILDRYLNILPTFTIREGQRIKVYLSQDVRLAAYHNAVDAFAQ